MTHYLIRRLLLLPLTLLSIILVNFVIINLAPGDPVSVTQISPEGGASRRESRNIALGTDDRYLQFREFYGLTLPIFFNTWPSISLPKVKADLMILIHQKWSVDSTEEIPFKEYESRRIRLGDQARYVMSHLITVMNDEKEELAIRRMSIRFFVRGGMRQGFVGASLTEEQRAWNRKVAEDNQYLLTQLVVPGDSVGLMNRKIADINRWYQSNKSFYRFEPTWKEKIGIFFFETRFIRYMDRVIHLDFGTMRNDPNKYVLDEVVKRFKYSLTLSLLPMAITLFFCLTVGFLMAYKQNKWPDLTMNLLFLILYAIPIFVVVPFLIEKVALYHTFPFTDVPIPISGFTSSDEIYDKQTSLQRLFDVIQHIALPWIAIMYGGLAAQARLSRTAVLEVLRQDYIRTAWAKGVAPMTILFHHVGRNAAIPIVTSIAGSLGLILGGSLIVETLFGINGFGKFFYDGVINRDYNVIMFSALAGSFLTLAGYLLADLAYTWLDPRITLE
jgi:peptide/nickel transport system permease protein